MIVVNRAIDLVQEKDRQAKKAAADAAGGEGEEGEGDEAPADAAPEEGAEEENNEMTPKTLHKRVQDLTESITYQSFNYTRRGTFEQHKLIISTMLAFRILIR